MLTIDGAFRKSAEQHAELTALRYVGKDGWRETSYRTLAETVTELASGLIHAGAGPATKIAIMSENRPEWVAAYLAIVGTGAVAVPIDAQLGAEETSHILNHSEASLLFCSPLCARTVAKISDDIPHLKTIYYFDAQIADFPITEVHEAADGYGIAFATKTDWTELIVNGRENPVDLPPDGVSETDTKRIASIIYTSGTTGTAKGVMLSHRNIMANTDMTSDRIPITSEDGLLLLLPLHHSFPFTTCMVWPLINGSTVDFVDIMSKDRLKLIMECRPTIMVAVPLLYSKMFRALERQVESSFIKSLLYRYGGRGIIGRALKKKLGGRIRHMISGAAPIDPAIIEGFRALGIDFLEGYGLTETSPVVSVNPPHDVRLGSVGSPLKGVEVTIFDPDENGIGEIGIRGENVMEGYYKSDGLTNMVITKDGWFKTGDVGRLDNDSYIYITGRAKDLIVTPGGKNVYPEIVESHIGRSPYIEEVIVIGYKTEKDAGEHVGVLAYPNFDELLEKARSDTPEMVAGIEAGELPDKLKSRLLEKYRSLIEKEIKQQTKDLATFQQPTQIGIEENEFVKTSTRKIRRFIYKGRLDTI